MPIHEIARVKEELAKRNNGQEPYSSRARKAKKLGDKPSDNEEAQLQELLENADDVAEASRKIVATPPKALSRNLREDVEKERAKPPAMGPSTAIIVGVGAGLRIWRRVRRRFRSCRNHGTSSTIVEEVAREIGGDPIGRAVWGQMKEAGAKAFAGSEETHGGMALLSELRGLQQQDYKTRVVLVGHSAGAIFICELLRAVAKQERHPGLRFDVVFLAPACTFKLLDDTLELATNFVGSFRCFAMQDALEQADWVLRPIYTRSLLYFVSGLLEGEPDEPIVGMARFHTRKSPFEDHSFPGIRRTLDRLAVHSKGWIWAIADGDRGAFMIPRAIDHLRSSLLPVRSTGRRMASGWRRSKRGSPQGTIAQPRASSNALQSEVDLTVRDCLRLRANWVRCTGARQQWHTS